MNNKFKFVIPSYNNENFVEYNLASILNQTYQNFEVLYIDDASTDNTFEVAKSIIGDDARFKIVKRDKNMGAAYNYFFELEEYLNNEEDIIIHLDGDDWLYDENVLQKLLDYYESTRVWMTYGKFLCYDGSNTLIEAYPQNTAHPEYVREYKKYRRDIWRASHLRTYKTFLFKAINKDDLYSKIDNKLFWHALDLAFQYPYMEMSSPDKIGVVDFPTCVYNQAPKNTVRTREREDASNSKYEDEIRNKKVYKSGLSGETLPQINSIGTYLEDHFHPTKFTYCYNRPFGDYDAIYIQDENILRYLAGEYEVKKGVKVIARVCENKKFFKQYYVIDAVKSNHEKFDIILTWEPELLHLSNAKFCPITDVTQFNKLPKSEVKVLREWKDELSNKTKLVSMITSNKYEFEGHINRMHTALAVLDKVDMYGRGIREIHSKLESLVPYMFSIAIENAIDENYFTEKLTDCFRTGTIPIYQGCPNIGDFFDKDGIITFETKEELLQIIDGLSIDLYKSKLEALKRNFYSSFKYPSDNDSMYELYYKDLI